MDTRLGVLFVSDEFSLACVKRGLPAGHAVVATREHPDLSYTEALIEGPMMPECPQGQAPQTVRLVCHQVYAQTKPGLRVWWLWDHLPNQEWEVDVSCIPPLSPPIRYQVQRSIYAGGPWASGVRTTIDATCAAPPQTDPSEAALAQEHCRSLWGKQQKNADDMLQASRAALGSGEAYAADYQRVLTAAQRAEDYLSETQRQNEASIDSLHAMQTRLRDILKKLCGSRALDT